MTLRELLKVTTGNEYITLRIENKWYPITRKCIDIVRPDIFDMKVKDILGGYCDGEPSLTVTLEDPEVPPDERPRDDNSVGIVWERGK